MELNLVERRYQAVLEVLNERGDGHDVARGSVARETVHDWLRRYAVGGLGGGSESAAVVVSA